MSESSPARERVRFVTVPGRGEVSALLIEPPDAWAALAFGHGAGAGMGHPFMADVARRLAARGVATFRYQFPYMEAGRRAPDRAPALMDTVRAAVAATRRLLPGLPPFAGGKSMGGRMTSLAAAESPLEGVSGLAFFGFPLHPARRPSVERADHLDDVGVPLLFLQGTRDALADLELLQPIVGRLGERASLAIVDGADHGFHVPKRSGRDDGDVREELAARTAGWMRATLAGAAADAAAGPG